MEMYIIGKEPDRCGVCPCFHAETPMYCQAVIADVQKPRIVRPYAKGRPEWCPLISVPEPHGRLIDADALDKQIYNDIPLKVFGNIARMAEMRNIVFNAPTIIEGGE